MFWIDDLEWDLPCDIEREAEIKASDISGIMLDGSYFNDVLGTYMSYSVKIVIPIGMEMRYNGLYEILTQPVDGHVFRLPYANGVIEITGRVTSVKDLYARMPNREVHWRGIQFDVIANHPSKEMSLGQVVSIGLAPLPSTESVDVGNAFIYTVDGWTQIEDADSVYY